MLFRTIVAAAAALFAHAGLPAAGPKRMDVTLEAQSIEPAAGGTIMLAIRMTPKPGWHGYWSNPGDSGLPPKVHWQLPDGVSVGALRHPAPQVLKVAGMSSYVHEGEHVLLAPMKLSGSLPAGKALPIRGAADFLVCSDKLCVPEKADLAVDLIVGDGSPAPSEQALFARASNALPQRSSASATYEQDGTNLRIVVSRSINLAAPRATFFPVRDAVFDRRSTKRLSSGDLEIVGAMDRPVSGKVAGVLSDGDRSYSLVLTPARSTAAASKDDSTHEASQPPLPAVRPDRAEASSPANATLDAAPPLAPSPPTGTIAAVLGALLGGLLLNLMPCVFPILSLKAMHLARAGQSASNAKQESLAYLTGTVAATTALGLVILALRAAGINLGWSFQLQSPAMIFALLLLVTAIAFNLAGLFHLTGPTMNTRPGGERFGSFGVGAMAAVIATPCSAPFMAGALGAAIVLPGWQGLAVFSALGIGLGLPFLAIGWLPALRERLPRPGAWMGRFQRALSVPMFVTAVGLAWILGRQSGPDGMALGLSAALLLAISLWWFGHRQRTGKRGGWLAPAAAIAASVGLMVAMPFAPSAASGNAAAMEQAFSEARLQSLRASGRPVFVDFTADWCLTCKVNEKLAINREATRRAFAEAGVVTLTGDWTSGDPAITRFLARHGRNSIPFYLFYGPGQSPRVLPQVLTTKMLVDLAAERTVGNE